MADAPRPVRVGVLALQGSFREHAAALAALPGVAAAEVRTAAELAACDGLVIPGGESTTMALVAERWGLVPELRAFAGAGARPVWGTCAGLIFLADRIESGAKAGGQALLGGLDVRVARNFFGAQVESFEIGLPAPPCLPPLDAAAAANGAAAGADAAADARPPFRALFIRAPAILEAGPGVEPLAEYTLTPEETAKSGRASVIVAVRQGPLLATAFHPELTDDRRWHALFVEMVRASAAARGGSVAGAAAEDGGAALGRPPTRPMDMPVY
jgi:5'-phosphate synthase pdxT subunit